LIVLWRSRENPWLPTGWLWYLGVMVPVIGIVQVGVQSIADRYTYLPLIGLTIIVAWGAEALARKSSVHKTSVAAAAVLVLAGSFASVRSQVRVWRDTETLFTHAVSTTQSNWVAHANLGAEALRKYQALLLTGAREETKESRERAELLRKVVYHCSRTLEYQPGFADAHVMLSKALIELGEFDTARRHLELALRLAPGDAEAHQNMAEISYRRGNHQQAVLHYRKALGFRPEWESVMNNLAWVLSTTPVEELRDGSEAVRLAEHASRLTSRTNLAFLHTLAAAYAEAGDFHQAQVVAQEALSMARSRGLPNDVRKFEDRLGQYRNQKKLIQE
jgi:protein O-mannosyl-transferase